MTNEPIDAEARDPVSAALSTLRVRSVECVRVELGEPWAVIVSPVPSTQLHLLLDGAVWFEAEGEPRQVFRGGACWSIPSGSGYKMGAGTPRDYVSLEEALSSGATGYRRCAGGPGPMATMICIQCDLGPRAVDPLAGALPASLVVPEMSKALAGLVPILDQAIRDGGPGAQVIAVRLAESCLVEFLRSWLTAPERADGSGWFAALVHPGLSRALGAMMATPEAAHDVASLARCAAMSRSGFAETFHALVGVTPLAWLSRFRVKLAARRLLEGESVERAASSVGFVSTSAFSRAFVRENGMRPGRWARASQASRSVRTSPDAGHRA